MKNSNLSKYPSEIDEIQRRISRLGIRWDELSKATKCVVLFGSRALQVGSTRSDYDVLCVGNGRSRRTKEIDLLWVSEHYLESDDWFGSEIACHIKEFGICLAGSNDWINHVALSEVAVRKKLDQIEHHLCTLKRRWNCLLPAYRQRQWGLLRRNFQRFALLSDGKAIPPTPILDGLWRKSSQDTKEKIFRSTGSLLASFDVSNALDSLLEKIGPAYGSPKLDFDIAQ